MSRGSGARGASVAFVRVRSMVVDGAAATVAGAGRTTCGEHGHAMQSGGQRPSGPSSGHRSGHGVPNAVIAMNTTWATRTPMASAADLIGEG